MLGPRRQDITIHSYGHYYSLLSYYLLTWLISVCPPIPIYSLAVLSTQPLAVVENAGATASVASLITCHSKSVVIIFLVANAALSLLQLVWLAEIIMTAKNLLQGFSQSGKFQLRSNADVSIDSGTINSLDAMTRDDRIGKKLSHDPEDIMPTEAPDDLPLFSSLASYTVGKSAAAAGQAVPRVSSGVKDAGAGKKKVK